MKPPAKSRRGDLGGNFFFAGYGSLNYVNWHLQKSGNRICEKKASVKVARHPLAAREPSLPRQLFRNSTAKARLTHLLGGWAVQTAPFDSHSKELYSGAAAVTCGIHVSRKKMEIDFGSHYNSCVKVDPHPLPTRSNSKR